jgi:hypothetical protein
MKKVKGALAGKEFAQRIWKVQAEHPGSEELITRKLKDAIDPLNYIRVGKLSLARQDLGSTRSPA